MRPIDLKERFRGALVGVAIGDALGAPVEGRPHVESSYLESLDVDPISLTYTDDTAMTIGVAESLLSCRGFDGGHMATTLADVYESEPWRGYGPGPPKVFARLRQGVPWNEAAINLYGGQGSLGNGGAMRVAPVALFAYPDLELTVEIAAQSARITHSHPGGVDGAVVQAVALGRVLQEDPLDPEEIVDHALRLVTTSEFQTKLGLLEENLPQPVADGLVSQLGRGVEAHASVVTALACFLSSTDSFPRAVKTAIALGGDTDTIASMTGALAGAYRGMDQIPPRWLDVEGTERLIGLADELYDRIT